MSKQPAMKARDVKDGEWVRPKMTGYIFECCGCGMMHRMDFRVQSDGVNIEMRGARLTDQEATDIRANLVRGDGGNEKANDNDENR